ncbi:antitoxin MazE-like protein [Ciceribacter sp. L1K22]|uniref:antitoxin MazE-like protein n=1 Tax=Ciceribacter sp. L1K22 TaxID=2820275 RepID=UPI001ABE3174|nr:antitoxin MazE-like protein [Ciceribacter sp. L1K22]MBO3759426.1 DUF3018 family protein [Ciceribacter sp. L1K22]
MSRTSGNSSEQPTAAKPAHLPALDTGSPDFAEECRRQAKAAAESDARDGEFQRFLEAVLDDLLE